MYIPDAIRMAASMAQCSGTALAQCSGTALTLCNSTVLALCCVPRLSAVGASEGHAI
jgi:hypothetical protein